MILGFETPPPIVWRGFEFVWRGKTPDSTHDFVTWWCMELCAYARDYGHDRWIASILGVSSNGGSAADALGMAHRSLILHAREAGRVLAALGPVKAYAICESNDAGCSGQPVDPLTTDRTKPPH
jgi:hypothetical protein